MSIDQQHGPDGRGTTDAARISKAFRKRRWGYAWRGAGIGAFLGFLTLGSMALFAVKSSNPEAGEGMLVLQAFLGAPVYMALGKILDFLTVASNKVGIPGQWTGTLLPVVYLSIPLNWGMFGFVIGWLVGSFRSAHSMR